MLRVFQDRILDPEAFVITLELVPGRESTGRAVDTVMGIAREAFADGRISAVSITDNPGGNPSLSPDVIGHEIFKIGMDVIVHFTCRDMNRVGMESRALQLAMMGMKNILALTGDYSGKGFGGQGAPVFDLDSVNLQVMLTLLSRRVEASGDPDGFFTGCAVSPFKVTESECHAQYAKLCRKIAAGADFVITQLGYDARKFDELIQVQERFGMVRPTLGSVYYLTPGAARTMNAGKVPGAVVTDKLLERLNVQWRDKNEGRKAAVERAARLGAVLRGLGYRGIHLGGIHRSFDTAGAIIDRLEQIQADWPHFLEEFDYPQKAGFYAFTGRPGTRERDLCRFGGGKLRMPPMESAAYHLFSGIHRAFFEADSPLAAINRRVAGKLDASARGRALTHLLEDPLKRWLLGCRRCGDCAIAHLGFLCPESGCPKHTRNGACGGSVDGACEVHPDRMCVWVRAHRRLAAVGKTDILSDGCVPPRMWELDQTSAWLNFHMGVDHHADGSEINRFCRNRTCRIHLP